MRLLSFILASALLPAAFAQSVISVRAGVVNACEGAVFVGGQPVSSRFGTFPRLHEGADLNTQDGRAELLLSPDVYLRVGRDSAVRMLSASLSDTKIQVLNGSVIFDSGNARTPGPVTLVAAGAQVHADGPARLRIDSDSAQLIVEKGEARLDRAGESVVVHADQVASLTGDSVVKRMTPTADDELEMWSQQRNRMIFLSLATSQSLLDPGIDPDPAAPVDLSDWLGYLPYTGVLPVTGMYSTVQPSLGYTYAYSPWLMGPYPGVFYGAAFYRAGYSGGRALGYGSMFVPTRPAYGGSPYRGPAFTPVTPSRGGFILPRPSAPMRPVMPAPRAPIHR
jgi:hypothetical protein